MKWWVHLITKIFGKKLISLGYSDNKDKLIMVRCKHWRENCIVEKIEEVNQT